MLNWSLVLVEMQPLNTMKTETTCLQLMVQQLNLPLQALKLKTASTTGAAALTIDNDDVDQIALDIDAARTQQLMLLMW